MEPIASDDELKAQIAQHLCVLSSGYIEEAVRLTLTRFAEAQSSPRVAAYASSQLNTFQNPRFEKIMVLLSTFDPSWRSHFEAQPTSEMKDAVDSIVKNRNQISHGHQVGLSLATFNRYFVQVKLFVDELDQLVDL